MSKTLLVIQREYLTRVRKPSFWILTIVVPILIAGLYAIPIVLASKPIEHANVLVADETGLFESEFRSVREVTYLGAGSLDFAKRQMEQSDTIDAIVYVPRTETMLPTNAYLYYRSDLPSVAVQTDVEAQLQEILRNRILIDIHGITPDEYAMLTSTRMTLRTQDIETGRDGFLKVKMAVGGLLALLVFMAVFLFSSQVMRGVMEEKSSRIVEVIVSSVKPFQLMMGKVVGIGLVGLTQFVLWVMLSGAALGGLRLAHADLFDQALKNRNLTEIATKGSDATAQMAAAQLDEARYQAGEGADKSVLELIEGLSSINFGLLAALFLFYFVVGYLLYASLFAAVGSLVDSETDSQQFTIPVTIPLVLCILLMPAMIQEPSGTLSVWLSVIPFTSPVAMLLRIPFGVKIGQLVLSMVLLLAAFPCCIWAASKIYRNGILHYGRKLTWKDLAHFLKVRK